MRVWGVGAALWLGMAGLAVAQGYATPEAMLEALYAPYLDDEMPGDNQAFRSAALNALYDAKLEADGNVDFDPVIVGQDWTITDFAIDAVAVDGDTATAHVSFNNFDAPTELDYALVNEDGWKIDNIVSTDADMPFSLVDVLTGTE